MCRLTALVWYYGSERCVFCDVKIDIYIYIVIADLCDIYCLKKIENI